MSRKSNATFVPGASQFLTAFGRFMEAQQAGDSVAMLKHSKRAITAGAIAHGPIRNAVRRLVDDCEAASRELIRTALQIDKMPESEDFRQQIDLIVGLVFPSRLVRNLDSMWKWDAAIYRSTHASAAALWALHEEFQRVHHDASEATFRCRESNLFLGDSFQKVMDAMDSQRA